MYHDIKAFSLYGVAELPQEKGDVGTIDNSGLSWELTRPKLSDISLWLRESRRILSKGECQNVCLVIRYFSSGITSQLVHWYMFETGQRDVSEDEAEGKLAWYCFWETAPIYTVSSVEVADKADNA